MEAVTAVVVSSLLPKLVALLEDEYKLPKVVKQSIKILRERLQMFAVAIYQDRLTDVVSREILDLSYDIEDTVDSFMISVGDNPGQKPFRRKGILRRLKAIHIIRQQIHDLMPRVNEMSMWIGSYHSEAFPIGTSSKLMLEPRLPALYAGASGLVGLDGPRHQLTELLLMEKEEEEPKSAAGLKAVSIVGLGGIGKTTLAKEVYSATKEYFQLSAWVSVSPNPNIQEILVDIHRQVGYPNSSGSANCERDLIRRISKALREKRYLLVLDDLWSTGILEIIKSALPLNNLGSRVITTTRSRAVAEACCSHWNGYIYNVLALSSNDSWMMFERRVFGNKTCPPDLVDVADKILRKCSGVPLAIASMSALLASKPPSRERWKDLCNSMACTSESIKEVEKILQLNYNDLPHHLKACFLYLGTFPEDHQISCDHIISCWIAEGFVLGNRVKTLEEVGESYLDELVNRSMIQPVHNNYDGKLVALRIHDLWLDIIRSISYKEEFVSFVDISRDPESVLHRNLRRLSIINTSEHNCIPQSGVKSNVRSLFIFVHVGLNFSFKQFIFLRMLDLEGCKDLKNHHIIEITKLYQLRYLSIRDTPISEVPYQIGQLHFLKTLDLRGTEVQEFPGTIVQLQVLEHLLCNKMRLPQGIGKMEALSRLSQFDIFGSKSSVVKELGNLSKLRELELWWFPDTESNDTETYDELVETYEELVISLNRLNKLQSLCIHGGDNSVDLLVDLLDDMPRPLCQLQRIQLDNSCYLRRIPKWFRSLANLKYLCIDVNEVKNEDLQLLAELKLQHLSLSSRAMPTEELVIRSYGFPALQNFHLQSARADLKIEPRAMPELERLQLSLHVLPEEKYSFSIDISHLACLKKIDIRVIGKGRDASELFEAANAVVRKAADEHPNHPAVDIIALGNLTDYALMEGKEKEQEMEPSEVDLILT